MIRVTDASAVLMVTGAEIRYRRRWSCPLAETAAARLILLTRYRACGRYRRAVMSLDASVTSNAVPLAGT